MPSKAKPLIDALAPYAATPITVSLSGGVDSMLMAALLVRNGFDVVAIHIVYGNRAESSQEQNFIETYCYRLGIPLHIYTIEHLKRATADRAFYESATRDLRFSAYQALKRPTLLGHIQEDVVENIWTNFAHGTHLDNPAKFAPEAVESGVKICRPWLHIKKELIYEVASELAIPHLKNTTPAWSNRGKFRTDFHAATHAQYGPQVDKILISVASRLKQQAMMLDKLLYQAISNSWDPQTRLLNITCALPLNLGHDDWFRIFTDLAHNKLHIQKPSLKACAEFVHRVSKGLQNNTAISLKKDFIVKVLIKHTQTWLQVL
jgi:tRNA(Ile)-lysidine synthetase-like protein